jgi:hypothetical protein
VPTPRRPPATLLLILLALTELCVRVLLRVPGVGGALPCGGEVLALCDLGGYLRWMEDGAYDPDLEHHPRFGHTNLPAPNPGLRVSPEGFRGPSPDPRRADCRAVLLGDSFVFGDEATDDEIFPTLLRQRRPGLDLINLGVRSFADDQAVLRYREQGAPLRPQLVVLGHTVLMGPRNGWGWLFGPKLISTLEDGRWVLEEGTLEPPSVRWAALRWTPWTWLLLRAAGQLVTGSTQVQGTEWALTEAILESFVREVEAAGAVAVVMHLPTIEAHFEGDGPFAGEVAALRAWCGRREGVCVDLLPRFEAAWAAGVETQRGGHWNEVGHGIVAEAVEEVVDRWVPCGGQP